MMPSARCGSSRSDCDGSGAACTLNGANDEKALRVCGPIVDRQSMATLKAGSAAGVATPDTAPATPFAQMYTLSMHNC